VAVHGFEELAVHLGHAVTVVSYGAGQGQDADNIAVECTTCSTVLQDFDRTPPPPPAAGLDGQIAAGWDRLHADGDALAELVLRRIARTVAESAPTAATLRLVIRYPDEVGLPDGWSPAQEPLWDGHGQPVELAAEAADRLDDDLREDLDALAFLEEVHHSGEIDLCADPPTLTATDQQPAAP
jgi:hypothetical protein